MKKIVLMCIALLLLIAVACDVNDLDFEDLNEPPLESLVAVPIGELTYTMRELLDEIDDDEVEIREDSSTTLITLAYFDTIQYQTSDEIIEIDDVVNQDTVELPEVTGPGVVNESFDLEFEYPATEQERLDEVEYESGEIELRVFSNFIASRINYTFTIEDTFDPNEVPVTFTDESTNSALNSTRTQDLTGYTTTLREQSGQNIFDIDFNIIIELGSGESLPAGSEVRFELTYRNQTFNIIYGYFGQDTLDIGNQSIDLGFFSELSDDGIFFENPQFNMTFFNDIGIPVGMDFTNVYGIKTDTASGITDTTFLEGPVTNNVQRIGHPDNTQVGETIESDLSINAFNSSIDELFQLAPDELVFDISAISNPGGSTGENFENFFQPGGEIETFIAVELPMSVQFRDLTREVDFDLGDGVGFDEADSVSLRLVTSNLFPFSANLTLTIEDENEEVLYTAPETLVISTAFLNSSFVAEQPEVQISNIPLSPEGIDALNNGSRLNLIISLNTPESLNSRDIFVDLLARYSLTVKVGVSAKLNVKI